MTVFLNERRRLSFYGGPGACIPVIFFFLIFTPLSHLSWVSELTFSQDIGHIVTWKVFFMKNLLIYEKSFRSRHFVL